MCLKFTYFDIATQQRGVWKTKIHGINDLQKRLMQTWFDFDQNVTNIATDQWRDRLGSCASAGGGHFAYMLWNECSFIWLIKTFYETVNVTW